MEAISWLDFDHAARDKTQRMLALFKEPGTRDELGLGSIRDFLADQMFPGISTIQTRLKYMLLVPYVYDHLEKQRVRSNDFAAEARRIEVDLIAPLIADDKEGDRGIIGSTAMSSLQRLPSSIYWSGLYAWGIRRFLGSRDEYHRHIDQIYAERKQQAITAGVSVSSDWETASITTWHPKLPSSSRFPDNPSIKLSIEESQFLKDRILESQPDTYLAWLAYKNAPDDSEFPWEYTGVHELPRVVFATLNQARLFSSVMHGASLLYNLLLARLREDANLTERYSDEIKEWARDTNWNEMRSWDLGAFFQASRCSNHRISSGVRCFVERWHELACDLEGDVANDLSADKLVQERERSLKRTRSRFDNRTALNQWGGESGARRMDFRWPTVRQFMADLHRGLAG